MIQHIFFDLDHTLWDFERNSEECLKEIYASFLDNSIDYDKFIAVFRKENKTLWRHFESNKITHDDIRKKRFSNTLNKLGTPCSESQSLAMNSLFMELLPKQKYLLEGCLETLEYLYPKYKLHIISNGYLEIQTRKMTSSGILAYFTEIITSDVAQTTKPDPLIFNISLDRAQANRSNSIYIGDDEIADKIGAEDAELPFIHYNIKADFNSEKEIKDLLYLKTLL